MLDLVSEFEYNRTRACHRCHALGSFVDGTFRHWRDGNTCRECCLKLERKHRFHQRHGYSHDKFLDLVNEQDGRCAICKQRKRLVQDHNHTTDERRGALCNNCNRFLGLAFENIDILRSAIKYLRRYQ
jgi:hypothetical protein